VATYEAFKKVEFLVVNEIFMTPTAALADIVLPAAWGMECDELGYWPDWQQQIRAHLKLVDPPGDAWSDTKIVNEVAKRLGLQEYFWEDDEEALDEMLKPSGLTFDEFKVKKRQLLPTREYKKHDYRTPSGKMEIYSQRLADMNFPPMPTWKIVSELPELSAEFPLMLTNYKEDLYVLSAYKTVASLRTIRPQPTVELHPDTAKKYGLKEGEWVDIETKTGKITQQLCFDPTLDPNVAMASFGWWFPEDGEKTQYGWKRANLNVLTEMENLGPECGSPYLRGIPCRVYKAENQTQTSNTA
jgi:anaerobic selenocysteine-containing dehydrogenase